MNSIEELCAELAKERDRLSQHTSRIASIESEIRQAMDRAQSYFSDQLPGQEIVRLLSLALNELVRADSAFYALGSEITSYVADLQK